MNYTESVAKMYDNAAEYEDNRLKQSPIHESEYLLTIDLLNQEILEHSHVLDLGSGTGIYSKYLIDSKKSKVALIDLSENEMSIFLETSKNNKKSVLWTKVKSAVEIEEIESESFDSILVFGPLYHLPDNADRNRLLMNCFRILKRKGNIFCSYISPYRVYKDIFRDSSKIVNDVNYMSNLKNGITFHTCNGIEAVQYRCWPSQAKAELEICGFTIKKARSLEGVFAFMTKSEFENIKEEKEKWLNILKENCENQDIIGASIHFLICGEKIC